MSCHSTPANVAVLGFHAHSFSVSRDAVEAEFHWLKKVGRDRAVSAPDPHEWEDFLMRQEQWARHEPGLSDKKRASITARLRESYDQVPDGQTYYALSNIPARLSQVTDTSLAQDALNRVRDRIDTLRSTSPSKDTDARLPDALSPLLSALGHIRSSGEPILGKESDEDSAGFDYTALQDVRVDNLSRNDIYLLHRSAMESLRKLRRIS